MNRPVFAVDANVIVAMACRWHEHHERAMKAVELRLRRSEVMITPAAALVEAYAVLTRLPAPHRIDPAEAWKVLEAGFVNGTAVISLSPAAHIAVLARFANQSIAGGRTYDALIGEAAKAGGAGVLLTFNARHLEPGPAGVSVVEP